MGIKIDINKQSVIEMAETYTFAKLYSLVQTPFSWVYTNLARVLSRYSWTQIGYVAASFAGLGTMFLSGGYLMRRSMQQKRVIDTLQGGEESESEEQEEVPVVEDTPEQVRAKEVRMML